MSTPGEKAFEQALVDTICATIAHDKTITNNERAAAVNFIFGFKELETPDRRYAEGLVNQGFQRIDNVPTQQLLSQIVASVPNRSRAKLIMFAAIGASEADTGIFSSGEEDFLAALSHSLNLNDDDLDDIRELHQQLK